MITKILLKEVRSLLTMNYTRLKLNIPESIIEKISNKI